MWLVAVAKHADFLVLVIRLVSRFPTVIGVRLLVTIAVARSPHRSHSTLIITRLTPTCDQLKISHNQVKITNALRLFDKIFSM